MRWLVTCNRTASLLHWTKTLILALVAVKASGILHGGSNIPCEHEGVPIDIALILGGSRDPCIQCTCQNKVVACNKDACKSCYFLFNGQDKKTCKGCTYKNKYYNNKDEWTDPEEPCQHLSCQDGIITKSEMHCYIPCRIPVPPAPGMCCPTCPGCKSDRRGTSEPLLPMPQTDPCVTCICTNGSMVCMKKACPVLPCPQSKHRQRPGSCCPECEGTRIVFPMDGKCLLGVHIFKDDEQYVHDECTDCSCKNTTSFCRRTSCPPIDCRPEQQVRENGDCCASCRAPEERRAICMANGKMYQDGDRWKIETCTHCSCQDGQVLCSVDMCETIAACPDRHTLKTLPGKCCPTCVEDDGVCTVYGDPHYRSFDGNMFNFQGSCKYQLVRDCVGKSFSVEVLNDSRYSKSFTWTKTVNVKVNGTKIRLNQNLKVHVNHKPVKLPYVQRGILSVTRDGYTVLVRTNLGVKVYWDGNSFLEVTASSRYKNMLCGLCGNYNGNKADDFKTRQGQLATSPDVFGNSWKVGRSKRCPVGPPTQSASSCKNPDVKVKAMKVCNVIKSAIFTRCHRPVHALPYFRSCLVDSCECRPRDKCYCDSLTAYARECARRGIVLDWRETSGCNGGRCGGGQQFMKCAPACRRTCKKPRKDKTCNRPCRPGCYCPPGTVWHRKQCIPLDECPT